MSQEGKTLDQVNNKLVWFSNNYPTSTAINKQNKNIRFQRLVSITPISRNSKFYIILIVTKSKEDKIFPTSLFSFIEV